TTPFIDLPGTLTAKCIRANGHTVLAWAPADPADKRPLKALLTETIGATWGLHLFDGNLGHGNLISLVQSEAAAWTASH
ncbi:MAG TPA: hypothetical protein VGM93_15070, partial [Acidimicrobiales bacterium]